MSEDYIYQDALGRLLFFIPHQSRYIKSTASCFKLLPEPCAIDSPAAPILKIFLVLFRPPNHRPPSGPHQISGSRFHLHLSSTMGSCSAQTNPNSQWPALCPNSGAAYLFAILFGLTLTAHIVQSIIYRKGYSWVIAMGALWQTACYVFRILSIKYVANETYYSVWFILMLVRLCFHI